MYHQDLLVSFSWLFSTLFASSRFVHILVTHPLSVNCWVRPFWACIWVPLWPSVMPDNIECSVTPSDRPNSLVYVHHFPAEGDDALLCEEFRHYGKIVSCKHQYFSGRPNLLTGSRILTISMFRPIPAKVMVDVYRTRVWYRGMQPFCQICKTMGHKAADCEFYGKCKECGAADHRARDCPSRRGGRVWSCEPIVVKVTVSPAVAETFPSIPVPEVAAAPPGVVVTEEVPDPSGVFIRSQ